MSVGGHLPERNFTVIFCTFVLAFASAALPKTDDRENERHDPVDPTDRTNSLLDSLILDPTKQNTSLPLVEDLE